MQWTPEQQKEHRKLWVEALRSGEYSQAKGFLSNGDGFCCLGVACEVSGLPYARHDISLPPPVRDWLGLADESGGFGRTYLTDLNDSKGKSFAEIADIIESEPEGLIAKAGA